VTEVPNLLTKNFINILSTCPIQEAHEQITKKKFRHLQVINHEGKIIGMLKERDIRRAINFQFNGINTVIDLLQYLTKTTSTSENYKRYPLREVFLRNLE
jgi:predicted transcriptional regulator